jgi:pyruvate dehydrogenase E2 component (dihydrolipoamide acetyltransferase)
MELRLPLLGDVMTEGTLVTWLQSAGAHVQAGEPLYQLETDKVNVTIEAPEAGVLERLVDEGQTVPVGTVVGRLVASSNGESPGVGVEDAEMRAGPTVGVDDAEVRASPAARRLARQLGVDLSALGATRRIREADVQAYFDAHAPRTAPAPSLTGRRKVIAERMRASLQQTAQLTIAVEVDMTDALRLREQLQQLLADSAQPTITDLVIRAAVRALRDHPALNATLEHGELRLHDAINVGLAVDADDGLIVPVIRNVESLSLQALAEQTRRLAESARANTLALDDLQGGTFTVTTLGALGVDFFTPIINPPQVAILGIGRVFDKLVLHGERPVERQSMYLNLSFDHQVIDGVPAARFLQSVKRALELPAGLLL